MEYTTVELIPEFKHRYKINANIYDVRRKRFEEVVIFLDSGCYNTMIPKYYAEICGRSLGLKREYKIGGTIVETEAYSIEKIMIGNVPLERVVAFAADYSGDFASDIILGANVMNNWRMVIDKNANLFQFCENPSKDLPNKVHIYQNYFNAIGNYVGVQDTPHT